MGIFCGLSEDDHRNSVAADLANQTPEFGHGGTDL
jgi:hypothetical protein